MIESPCKVLEWTWVKQAEYLRQLSRKDLEVLWFLLQEHEGALDRIKLAVFSILRDMYEAQAKSKVSVRP